MYTNSQKKCCGLITLLLMTTYSDCKVAQGPEYVGDVLLELLCAETRDVAETEHPRGTAGC